MKKARGNGPKNIRLKNQLIVLKLFRKKSVISASDITNSILMSKPTIMKILDELEDNRLIHNIGKGESSGEGGRKPNLYTFNATLKYCIAFHIFPHEIYGVITDLNQNILKDVSIEVDSTLTFEGLINNLNEAVHYLVKKLTKVKELAGIAIGSHGITDSEKGITFSSTRFPLWGTNAPIKDELEKRLGEEIPVYVDNQIRYQVLSEIHLSDKIKNLVVIQAGDGLVSGIYEHDTVEKGAHNLAGEVGHIPLLPNGPVCACGAKGCFEELVQIDRLIENAEEKRIEFPDSEIFRDSQKIEDPLVIFTAANKGDQLACGLVKDIAEWFARGIICLQLINDPEKIIIQGLYAAAGDYFLNCLRAAVSNNSPILKKRNLIIELSSLGKDRGVLGASLMIANNYLNTYLSKINGK